MFVQTPAECTFCRPAVMYRNLIYNIYIRDVDADANLAALKF